MRNIIKFERKLNGKIIKCEIPEELLIRSRIDMSAEIEKSMYRQLYQHDKIKGDKKNDTTREHARQ
jgi:hypothetical protein